MVTSRGLYTGREIYWDLHEREWRYLETGEKYTPGVDQEMLRRDDRVLSWIYGAMIVAFGGGVGYVIAREILAAMG